jgi:hypothetical protein
VSAFVIGVGSWVVVRDKTSAYDGVHGTVVAIEGETARVRRRPRLHRGPLAILRIPVDGTDPSVRAALEKLDTSGRDLHVKFDEAAVRLAAEAAQKIPGFNLPPEVIDALGPILKLVEIAVGGAVMLAAAFVVAIVGIALSVWAQDRNEEQRVLARWVGMVLAVAGIAAVFALAVVTP